MDESVVVRVGTYGVSRYLVDKYHGRFQQAFRSEHRRAPSREEIEEWIERFVADHTVIAHAIGLGYADHPEVVSNVARMERHMLTQLDGPLYRAADAAPMRTEEELRAIFEESGRAFTGVAARFVDSQARVKALGPAFDSLTLSDQVARVRACEGSPVADVVSGRLAWPYEPFIEITSVIASAPTGRWVQWTDPIFGDYVVYLEPLESTSTADFAASRPALEASVRLVDRQRARKIQRAGAVRRVDLAIDADAAANLLDAVRKMPGGPSAHSPLGERELFRYQPSAEVVHVSVDSFLSEFNNRVIRRNPRTASDLRSCIEDHVADALDLQRARAMGLDSTPAFRQDRAGYAGLQILDLFRREVLRPQIAISEEAVDDYVQKHAAALAPFQPIRGRIYRFNKEDDAVKWLRERQVRTAGGGIEDSTVESERVEFSASRGVSGLEAVHSVLLACPPGYCAGPFPVAGQILVFARDPNRAFEKDSAEVRDAARGQLARLLLDQEVLDLARRLRSTISVESSLGYLLK